MRPPLLVFLPLFAACAGDGTGTDTGTPVDPCAPSDAPTLQIGLGLTGYEPMEEGAPFPLIHGPQGGFHLEIGLFATGIQVDDGALLSGQVHGYIDGEEYASAYPRLDLRCVTDGRESYGTLLVYNSTPDFLDGKSTYITAEITDSSGAVVSAEATFTIDDSP